jgi:3-hydroxyacyl-CoA dehydrogenase
MTDTVAYEVRDGVAVLTVDRPPVNAIDYTVRQGLKDGIARAAVDEAARAVLIVCDGRTFMSGADLSELGGVQPEPGFYETLDAIEASGKPVVAAMHGTTLGGGLETALACHYRIADAKARMGLPEITLGLIPGGGGTQRLPRIVGAMKTLEMLVSGAPITAGDAQEAGLLDAVFEGDPKDEGLKFARRLVEDGAPPRPTRERSVERNGFSLEAAEGVLAKNARALKGRTTQNDAVKVVQAAIELPFEKGIETEDEYSRASLKAPESLALRHVFFAERECGKIPGLTKAEPGPLKSAAVVGAGTMGGGIAMAFANSGLPVTVIEAGQEALDRGLAGIRKNYETTVKRGRMSPEDLEQRMSLISGALDASGAAGADVAVEAVFENMDLKKKILADLDKVMPTHAIIASNTSTLSVTELGSVTSRPDKVVGLHFFSPAHIMRLLEIIRGGETSNQTLVTALEVGKKLRKIGVISGDAYGFIGNKMMQDGYFREAEQLLLEGASPAQVDRVCEAFGFAMGPNKVNDMAGVDVGTLARGELAKRESRPAPYFAVSDALTPMRRLGQKTGKGVYRYEPGDRTPYGDPEVTALIEKLAADHGIERRAISDAEVEERCVLPLVNEGAKLLENGIAYRASDIDVVWTSGYGFPRYKGGPMFHGDMLGLAHVAERVKHYHEKSGHYWEPSELLLKLADEGRTFADWDKNRG